MRSRLKTWVFRGDPKNPDDVHSNESLVNLESFGMMTRIEKKKETHEQRHILPYSKHSIPEPPGRKKAHLRNSFLTIPSPWLNKKP
jgi:hypothetical protein